MRKKALLLFFALTLGRLYSSENVYHYVCLGSFINEKFAVEFSENLNSYNIENFIVPYQKDATLYRRVILNSIFKDKGSAYNKIKGLYENHIELKLKDLWVWTTTQILTAPKLFDGTENQKTDNKTVETDDVAVKNTDTLYDNKKTELEEVKTELNKAKNESDKSMNLNLDEKIAINQKNAMFLKTKLLEYKSEKSKNPETAKEFADFIGIIPIEMFSGQNRISFTKDLIGGWYVDPENLLVEPNTDLFDTGKTSENKKSPPEEPKINEVKLISLVIEGVNKPDLWTEAENRIKNKLNIGEYDEIYEFIPEFKRECDNNYLLKDFRLNDIAYNFYTTGGLNFGNFISNIPADISYRRFLNGLTNMFDDNKNIEEFDKIFDTFIEKKSGNFLLLYVKGRILSILKKYDASNAFCDKSLAINPEFASGYHTKGNNLSYLNDLEGSTILYEKAITFYDKEILTSPQDADAYNNKGGALYNLERYEEAIEAFDKAIEIDPKFAYAYYNKGVALDELKRYEEAIACYDKAIEIDPRYVHAYNGKGNAHYNLKKYEEAIACYDKAIEIDPRYVHAYNNKGNALNDLERYEEAIACYDKAIEIDPRYVHAYNNKGNAFYELQRYEEAISYYDKAIEIDPNYVHAYYGKGNAFYELQRYEEAISYYDKAIEIDPKFADAYNNKGNAFYELQRYEEAISYYDKAIEIDPRYVHAYNGKGNALNDLQRYEEAISYFDKAIEIDPRYVHAYYNKGISLRNLERYEEAISYYDKAIEIDPRYVHAYYNKGNALYNLERYEEAIEAFDKALEIDPNHTEALFNKSIALKQLESQ